MQHAMMLLAHYLPQPVNFPAPAPRDAVGRQIDAQNAEYRRTNSMTMYKNEEQMGVMQAEGLSSPLCWAVSLVNMGISARIDSAALPEQRNDDPLAIQ